MVSFFLSSIALIFLISMGAEFFIRYSLVLGFIGLTLYCMIILLG